MIISAWDEKSTEMRGLLEAGLPIVLLNRTALSGSFDSITSDNHSGGSLVAKYFYQHGKQRLVFLQGGSHTSTSSERLHGFQEGLHDLGQPAPIVLNGDFSFERSFSLASEYIEHFGAPDAFFCANDYMAFGVLNAVKEAGLTVPDDVWVVGYDNVQQSRWPLIDLTTISQDSHRMAELGARRLLERIENPDAPTEKTILPVRLEVRGTTARASFSQEEIVR